MNVFFFIVTLFLSLKIIGLDLDLNQNNYKIPIPDPNKTQIVLENKDYLILHNPSEFSYEMMKNQAGEICARLNGLESSKIKFMSVIGIYTAYFSCGEEDDINLIENSDKEFKIRTSEFLYILIKKNINAITSLEEKAEKERIKTLLDSATIRSDLKTIKDKEKIQKSIDWLTDINIYTCKKYNFEVNSDFFNECLLKLIETPLKLQIPWNDFIRSDID